MASINKSFLYGIGFASITWIISLYLYSQLMKNPHGPKMLNPQVNDMNSMHGNEQKLPLKSNKYAELDKSFYAKNQGNAYKNSNKLLKKLQPVPFKFKNASKAEQDLIDLGMVQTLEEQKLKDEGYKAFAFNILISNKLSYDRKIPDTRNERCKNISYEENLPSASIIICFYNEHFQTLLRTIHSILNRTLDKLLKEIILVDDYSDIPRLHDDTFDYLKNNSINGKVKLFKPEKREGLIRARIFGANKATGDVIIFLDSHIEVNVGWIEPLLSRIKQNKTNVVMPIIDIINADTFAYSSSPLVRGGFNWGLHFKWENLPKGTLSRKEDFVKPIKSPTMAGGLFAINRKYFIDIGEYDAGMNIWGGENLEISFRIWMCGGNLEMIPCSRVGHVFRHRRPYGAPDGQDTMLYNSLRVANVWMDSYKDYFLSNRKDAKNVDFGDITSRVQLRKELKCKDFDWYLKNVYPELALPSDDQKRLYQKWSALERDNFQPWHSRKRNYIGQFHLKLSGTDLCIQSSKDIKTKGATLILNKCSNAKTQMWYESDKNEFVLGQLLCLQSSKSGPILYKCHEMGADQEWQHRGGEESPVYNIGSGTCLGVNDAKVNEQIVMKLCTDSKFSKWDFVR